MTFTALKKSEPRLRVEAGAYLTVPWRETREIRMRQDAWYERCRRRGQPWVIVREKPDGRALLHYDLCGCCPDRFVADLLLFRELQRLAQSRGKDQRRRLAFVPGAGRSAVDVGSIIGWVAYEQADPAPRDAALYYLSHLLTGAGHDAMLAAEQALSARLRLRERAFWDEHWRTLGVTKRRRMEREFKAAQRAEQEAAEDALVSAFHAAGGRMVEPAERRG